MALCPCGLSSGCPRLSFVLRGTIGVVLRAGSCRSRVWALLWSCLAAPLCKSRVVQLRAWRDVPEWSLRENKKVMTKADQCDEVAMCAILSLFAKSMEWVPSSFGNSNFVQDFCLRKIKVIRVAHNVPHHTFVRALTHAHLD